MEIYTLEELMYKVEQHLENIEDSKTDEELDQLAKELVAKTATILLEDGTYIYDKENDYVVFTPSE